ncbi:hypothetical protein GO998_24845 (plasmid) [Ralstonia syzygii]|uniref:Uncharacterized protein n=1 Tax=Ralstonia syzygii TaxID=28097 RepID=A0ABX7ZNV8_9RALS|nr:hypothetical protein [Ralstonia syzygii]QUP56855.1 hypothetical protein GO998_24845 [Ralstonia syzygii]
MESKDIEICSQIGQILYDAAPDEVSKVSMKAELNQEGDVCKFEYDYLKEGGESGWFLPKDGMVEQRLRELLVLHRDFFVSQNQPPWKHFVLSIDVEEGKFSLQLAYD